MDNDKKEWIAILCHNTIKYSEPETTTGHDGSNTDSGYKRGVQVEILVSCI